MTDTTRQAFDEYLEGSVTDTHGRYIGDAFDLWQAATERATPQWQPIETAPKDGTEIILYQEMADYQGQPALERRTVGHWLYQEGGTREHRDLDGNWIGQDDIEGYEGWLSWDGGFTEESPPTRWMPLPPPPAIRQGDT